MQWLGGEGLPGWEEQIQVRSQQRGLQILTKASAGMVCPKHCFRKTSLGLVVRIIGVMRAEGLLLLGLLSYLLPFAGSGVGFKLFVHVAEST